jgi:hypothetical protein
MNDHLINVHKDISIKNIRNLIIEDIGQLNSEDKD